MHKTGYDFIARKLIDTVTESTKTGDLRIGNFRSNRISNRI